MSLQFELFTLVLYIIVVEWYVKSRRFSARLNRRFTCYSGRRVLGIETVDAAVQQDIRNEKALEEKQRMEQMPKGSIHERLAWGIKKSEM